MNDSFMFRACSDPEFLFCVISKALLSISVRRLLKMMIVPCRLAMNAHQLQPLSMPNNWHQFAYEIPYFIANKVLYSLEAAERERAVS